ncbi:MAG TPA: hypothetical protein VFQ51_11780 [Vicinamibacteria bacterium]|nr:hypothetical protein [Vicinamibacteria bacterium]
MNAVAAVVAFALLLVSWFARPAFLPAPLWLAPAAGLLAGNLWRRQGWRLPRPATETWLCVALALVYRLPALVHPWGWVNKDGAYGAFVTLHLLQGVSPAPVFTEGANYQGTLKPHLAALLGLVTRVRDLSWLMTAASVLLSLVFLVATMALARRIGGRAAATATGLYLAFGPKFLTTFSLNCVGQYVDVLALGGLALALLARVLEDDASGASARGAYLAIGVLLGAAFWQQPVALSYAGVTMLALALRRSTWKDPWALLVPLGFALGALPVLLWNLQNGWGSGEIMGRGASDLGAQADALGRVARKTLGIAFPILAGLSPGHPWQDVPLVPTLAAVFLPALLLAFVAIRFASLRESVTRLRPRSDLLPVALMLGCVALAWAVAAGKVYARPRYLLPVMGAAAVFFGTVVAWLWARMRVAGALLAAVALGFNTVGMLPRLLESAAIARWYEGLVRAVEEKGIRTGYADFSIAAPVTMFTRERVLLSSALGPTPAYESDEHASRVAREGPDAFVLRPQDDPEPLASWLTANGVGFRLEREPVPIVYGLTRRVPVEEVRGLVRGASAPPEE